MARTCIFCDSPATRPAEHIIPRWIPEHMGLTSFVLYHRGAAGTTGVSEKVPFGEYKKVILCRSCQAHFANLESRIEQVLKPMIEGRTGVLGFAGQRLLSLWAAKTAFGVLAREFPEDAQPSANHRHFVRQNEQAPNDCGVWFGPYDAKEVRILAHVNELSDAVQPEEPLRCYDVVLAFGFVAFKVFGPLAAQNAGLAFKVPFAPGETGEPLPFAAPFWPPATVPWPSSPVLDDEGLNILSQLIGFERRTSALGPR